MKKFLMLLIVLTLLLASCGKSAATPPVENPVGEGAPSPAEGNGELQIVFEAVPPQVAPGECATLHWEISGPHVEVIMDGESLPDVGDKEVCPEGETPYFMQIVTETGVEERQVTVQVAGEGEAPPEENPTEAPPDEGGESTPPQPSPTAGPPPSADSLSWVRTGGPLGGLGYDVRMDPRNPDVMYVTDAWAGVFKSTDGGKTWFPSNQGITTRIGESGDGIPIFSLTVDPNNPDILWAGTDNLRGIYKSTDGGKTWTEMDSGVVESNGITFRGFTVEPGNSNVVYAAAEIASWTWAGEERIGREFDLVKGVVYKTTNGGKTWQVIWRGDNLARYVWIDPTDTNVIYVSTGIFDREAANSDPKAGKPGGVGVIKSVDGGKTWTQVNNGLDNLYVSSLYVHPKDPDTLLAGTGNNQYYENAGVYLTTDGGKTWTQVVKDSNIQSVEFFPENPNIAYAGGVDGFYRSLDGGKTWEQMSKSDWGAPGVRVGFPIDIQVDPRDSNRIFVNAYGGGNFLSTDGGKTWTIASKGYTGAQVRAVAVDPNNPAVVYAAARSGVFVSRNGGTDWEGLAYPPMRLLEWTIVAISPANTSSLVASNEWSGEILYSNDGGKHWQTTNTNIQRQNLGSWYLAVFAPSDANTVYAATAEEVPGSAGGMAVSHDGGKTWERLNSGIMSDASIYAIAIDPQNAADLFVASSNKGILHSQDGGKTWTQVGSNLPQIAFSIAMNPRNNQTLLAGFRAGGLYASQDGGQSWTQVTNGIPAEASIRDIIFDPTNPEVLYAADVSSGVYRSTDGGATWKAINSGLQMRAVVDLDISADGQHLYAATDGGGVYRLDINGKAPTGAP